MNEISLIKDTSKLSSFINLIQDSSIIGIDTEFMRRTTYWPVLCLIQISDGINTGIIDLISTNIDLSPLFKFLENRSIKKIFHSGEQDLEILWSKGASVKNIYDTQIASMFSGYKSQISYSDLVNTILNIKINKSQQNSNWQIRPLKDKQIQYAAEDVIHLPLLYKKLNEYIIQKDLNSWVSDEMDYIEKIRSLYIKKIEIKSLSDLKIIANNDSSLINLISSWRDNIAQKNNVPREYWARFFKSEALPSILNANSQKSAETALKKSVDNQSIVSGANKTAKPNIDSAGYKDLLEKVLNQ